MQFITFLLDGTAFYNQFINRHFSKSHETNMPFVRITMILIS